MDESHLKTDVVQRNFMETYRHMSKNHPHFGSLSHVDSKEWWLKIVHGAFKGKVWVKSIYKIHERSKKRTPKVSTLMLRDVRVSVVRLTLPC